MFYFFPENESPKWLRMRHGHELYQKITMGSPTSVDFGDCGGLQRLVVIPCHNGIRNKIPETESFLTSGDTGMRFILQLANMDGKHPLQS